MTRIWASFNWRAVAAPGDWTIRSWPRCVFGKATTSRMLERVVDPRHLAELHRAVHVPVEPQLFEVRDVPQIPDNGAHQRIVLHPEIFVGNRLGQPDRPLSRLVKQRSNALDRCIEAGARPSRFCHR